MMGYEKEEYREAQVRARYPAPKIVEESPTGYRVPWLAAWLYGLAFVLLAFVAFTSLSQRDRSVRLMTGALDIAEEMTDTIAVLRLRERAQQFQPPVIIYRGCQVPAHPETRRL